MLVSNQALVKVRKTPKAIHKTPISTKSIASASIDFFSRDQFLSDAMVFLGNENRTINHIIIKTAPME
jgi:hypothetical protein